MNLRQIYDNRAKICRFSSWIQPCVSLTDALHLARTHQTELGSNRLYPPPPPLVLMSVFGPPYLNRAERITVVVDKKSNWQQKQSQEGYHDAVLSIAFLHATVLRPSPWTTGYSSIGSPASGWRQRPPPPHRQRKENWYLGRCSCFHRGWGTMKSSAETKSVDRGSSPINIPHFVSVTANIW